MRHATFDLTPELFLEFLRASKDDARPRRFVVKENPLPNDVEIVSIGLANTEFTDDAVVRLMLHSEHFADIPEGESPPPVPRILYETVYDATHR